MAEVYQSQKNIDWDVLFERARAVSAYAYAPYSKYPVGVAGLVNDGRIVEGCNVENASYGLGLCAECGMISDLIRTGGGTLVAVACVNGNGDALMPCGRCRQLLWEHGTPGTLLWLSRGIVTLNEIFPHAFGPTDLEAVASSRNTVVPSINA